MRHHLSAKFQTFILIRIFALFAVFPVPYGSLRANIQNLQFNHLKVKDGLSQSWVRAILQDRCGFIWFGTSDGLNKYDGYTFTVYKNIPNNPNSLHNNTITALHENTDGNLWIGTLGGLCFYNREHDQFIRRKHWPQTEITGFLPLRDGRLYLKTRTPTQYLYIPANDSVLSFVIYNDENDPDAGSNHVNDFFMDRQGRLWFGTFNGVHIWDSHDKYFTYLLKNTDVAERNIIGPICEDRQGRIWIGTYNNGLILLKSCDTKPEFIYFRHEVNNENSLTAGPIFSLLEDRHGRLWIGTEEGGLDVLDLNNFQEDNYVFHHYRYEPFNDFSISHNSIYALYEDRQGTIWIGTYGDGVDFFNPLTKKFVHFKQNPDNPNSLNNNTVKAFFEDGDLLWIGTEGGLNSFDKKTNSFRHYVHDPNDPQSLGANTVYTIFKDSRQNLWVGTYGGGLNLLNRYDGTFVRFVPTSDDNSIGSERISSIIEDRQGNLWIGTIGGGLNRFDYERKSFIKFVNRVDDPESLSNNWVRGLFETHPGEIWISNDASVDLFDQIKGTFKHFTNENYNESINFKRSRVFFEDSQNHLWLGSQGSLNVLNRDTGQFKSYFETDGLPDNQIKGILEDDHGNLWISTNKGISKFIDGINQPVNPVFKVYDAGDGLQGNEFVERSCYKGRDGRMYFGGTNGFNFFHPDSLQENPYKPEVMLTRLLISNKPVEITSPNSPLKAHINLTKNLILSYKHSVITFEYTALNYIIPEKNQYAFKLEGFEEDWNYVGNKRSATYTNLDPGTYIFRVIAANNDGLWNKDGLSVLIKIVPPWWRTSLAYVVYLLLLIGLFYFIWRFQLNRERMKHQLKLEHEHAEKLEQINQMKTRFFSNITHEFRTPLTLIMGPIRKVLTEDKSQYFKPEYDVILRNSQKLYRLINQLLDLSRLEAGAMPLKTRKENIIPFLADLISLFNPLAEQKNIQLQFTGENIAINSKEILELYFDRDKLEKIVTNLLSNAIKFTPENGEVKVILKKLNGFVEIMFFDNGIGIPPENLDKIFDRFFQVDESYTREYEGTGIGLALIKELVELHHGTINVESASNSGTRFTVRLPLGKAHLKPEQIFDTESPERTESEFSEPDLKLSDNTQESNTGEKSRKSKKHLPVVLIVEDNTDLRKYLQNSLEMSYQISEAVNGEQGLELAIDLMPDLIVSDIMMPKLDGFELCKRIKIDERTSHIPVILLTARASIDSKIEGLETGADDYITKPFEMRELQTRAHNLIQQRRQLRLRFNRQSGLKPEEIATNSVDEEFLTKAVAILEKNINNPNFNVSQFAKKIAISRTHLNRKLQALTGQSTSQFILVFRLNRAAQLLTNKSGTVLEISYAVGIESVSYFSKAFRKHFGVSPSGYKKSSSNLKN